MTKIGNKGITFKPVLAEKDRMSLKKNLRKTGKKSVEDYPKALERLDKRLLSCDPIHTLAYCGFLEMYKPIPSKKSSKSPEPKSSHIEMIQAMFLRNDRTNYEDKVRPLDSYAEIRKLTEDFFNASSLRVFANEPDFENLAEANSYPLKEQTKHIRNPGSHSQMNFVNRELLACIDSEFEKYYGYKATPLYSFVEIMMAFQNDMVNNYRGKVVKTFNQKTMKKLAFAYSRNLEVDGDPEKTLQFLKEHNFTLSQAKDMFMNQFAI